MGQYYSLDYSKLDTILKDVKNTTLDYFPYFQEAFILLYETGCRVGELFEITRWRRINDTTLGLTPQKYNSERIIVIPAGVTLFPQWVDNQIVPWFGLSVVQLNALFMRYSPYTSYLAETKPVSLYLFRYRYIRYLASNGWSLADIQTIMGYSSQTVIHNYLNSALSYSAEAPVVPHVVIGGLEWVLPSFSISDGGSGVYSANLDSNNDAVFGKLYSYSAVVRCLDSHSYLRLPSSTEFNSLVSALGGSSVAGGSLKTTGTVYWRSPNNGATNSSGLGCVGSGFVLSSGVQGNYLRTCRFYCSDTMPQGLAKVLRISYNASDVVFESVYVQDCYSALFILQ